MKKRRIRLFLLSALAGALIYGISREASLTEGSTERARLKAEVRSHIEKSVKAGVPAAELGKELAWLNVSRPLSLKDDLAGKVVLIDFWTYCCINCMHVLPDLDYLETKYAREPFVVVGCHSAKFTNEAEAANVRQAILRYDIAHPVVVDEEFKVWRRYGVRSWPTLVLVGPDGLILAKLAGEGHRELLDVLVEEALAFYSEKPGALSPKPLPLRREVDKDLARELAFPGKVAADPDGKHLYIADSNHDRIVVVTAEGRFVRAIGSGRRGFKDGPSSDACFQKPQGLAFHEGSLLVADTENHAIRKVDLGSEAVTTIAGNGTQGHARSGTFDGTSVSLNSPWDILVRGTDALIAMAGPHQIWKLDLASGKITAFAGDGSERKADGSLRTSAFAQPSGLAETNGVVYVADSESSSIRTIDLRSGQVGTLAGGTTDSRNLFHFGDDDGKGLGRRFQHPLGVLVHDGVLYVADTYNHKVKTVDMGTGEVKTLAGKGRPGRADGSFADASFHEPGGLAAIGERLYVADTNNHRIRVLDLETRRVSTLTLAGVPAP